MTQKYFKNPWHNKYVKNLSDARVRYHKLFLLNLVTREQYSTFRNKVTNLIRKQKEKFYLESFARNSGNTKKTWDSIREICHGKTIKSAIDRILHNGAYYTKNEDIAALFNNFFVTIAHDLSAALPPPIHSPYRLQLCPTQYFSPNRTYARIRCWGLEYYSVLENYQNRYKWNVRKIIQKVSCSLLGLFVGYN